jgi:hypothetical protein
MDNSTFDLAATFRSPIDIRPITLNLTDQQRAVIDRRARASRLACEWRASSPPRAYRRLYDWRPLSCLISAQRQRTRVRGLRTRLAAWRPLNALALRLWRLAGRPGLRTVLFD